MKSAMTMFRRNGCDNGDNCGKSLHYQRLRHQQCSNLGTQVGSRTAGGPSSCSPAHHCYRDYHDCYCGNCHHCYHGNCHDCHDCYDCYDDNNHDVGDDYDCFNDEDACDDYNDDCGDGDDGCWLCV